MAFRNNNPDKGTETRADRKAPPDLVCLEIITPIRGRKLYLYALLQVFYSFV